MYTSHMTVSLPNHLSVVFSVIKNKLIMIGSFSVASNSSQASGWCRVIILQQARAVLACGWPYFVYGHISPAIDHEDLV